MWLLILSRILAIAFGTWIIFAGEAYPSDLRAGGLVLLAVLLFVDAFDLLPDEKQSL